MCATAGSSSTNRTRTSSSVIDLVELMVGSSRAALGEPFAAPAFSNSPPVKCRAFFGGPVKPPRRRSGDLGTLGGSAGGEKQVRRPGGSQGGASKEGGREGRSP